MWPSTSRRSLRALSSGNSNSVAGFSSFDIPPFWDLRIELAVTPERPGFCATLLDPLSLKIVGYAAGDNALQLAAALSQVLVGSLEQPNGMLQPRASEAASKIEVTVYEYFCRTWERIAEAPAAPHLYAFNLSDAGRATDPQLDAPPHVLRGHDLLATLQQFEGPGSRLKGNDLAIRIDEVMDQHGVTEMTCLELLYLAQRLYGDLMIEAQQDLGLAGSDPFSLWEADLRRPGGPPGGSARLGEGGGPSLGL